MATLEILRRKVDATEDLQSVVRTMKSLAAVNIRQYEEAAAALKDYRRTVELGLRVVLRHAHPRRQQQERRDEVAALIVVGSDQGMCGQFNEDVMQHAVRKLRLDEESASRWLILTIGEKLTAAMEATGRAVTTAKNVPGSAGAITSHVRSMLAIIEQWQAEHGSLHQVVLVHNRYERQNISPRYHRLLPLDEEWLRRVRQQPWPTHVLPMFTCSADELLSHLVRQYLFIELFGALAESLAAENATRLRAMQSAEKNVEERLDELSARYNRQRQNSITAELLDVISGSEAVAT
jgi:F-type H+-transporting ATPase subunit gamma